MFVSFVKYIDACACAEITGPEKGKLRREN
jgi:hypothetical protein